MGLDHLTTGKALNLEYGGLDFVGLRRAPVHVEGANRFRPLPRRRVYPLVRPH